MKIISSQLKLQSTHRQLKSYERRQELQLWEDDRFRVELSTNHTAWVYLVLQNNRGQRQLLFPRRGEAHQSSPGARLCRYPC